MTEKFNLLSDEQLASISSGKLWTFHGGVHPAENKTQSNQSSIQDAGISATLIIPVEHKGHIPELLVSVGDSVLKGQPLTKVYGAMVVQHASSSGTVIAIEKRCDLHPSGLSVLSVVIQTDGLDRSIDYVKPPAYQSVAPEALIEQVQQAGIVGLGGAGFPSHLKLVQHGLTKLLIVNAAECEPYITADDRLMQEQAHEIIEGIAVLDHILQPNMSVIAIEDNKPEAIASLREALENSPHQAKIILRVIPTIYPSGSAKQLIEIITGQQTPEGTHSINLGIMMLNVGTIFAIKEAIVDGKPLTSRIVTLTGDSVREKGNVSVRIGTPIQYLLDRYWIDSSAVKELIIGGPMMGFNIDSSAAPVTKTCNCILAPTRKEMPDAKPEMPCIRCSECAEACPATLLPQQLLWYSKSKEHDKLEQYNLSACIECGACAYVCPSHIPLVEYYRIAKAEISTAKEEAKKAEVARLRHENREARLTRAKLERQEKHKQAAEKRKAQMKPQGEGDDLIAAAVARAQSKKANDGDATAAPAKLNDAVSAALARAKAKKAAQAESANEPQNDKKAAVAAALARAKAKKAAQAEAKGETVSEPQDAKKAAVAAAIARAKAKKAAQAEAKGETVSEPQDAKKAAVAAAIARAKAKKAAQAEAKGETVSEPQDAKKAAVAAAIARAKEKKAAKAATSTDSEQPTQTEPQDPRKAAVAAAIARAKEKKAAKAATSTDSEQPTQTEPQDPRKAAVAAAIARAKEKKAAKAATSTDSEQPTQAEPQDPRKAAVAAAIARAKEKKAAKAATSTDSEQPTQAEPQDPRKVAVGAAIARAKEKKAAKTAADNVEQESEPDNSAVIAQRAQRKEQARLHKQQKAEADQAQAQPSAAQIKKDKIAAAVARAKAKKANDSKAKTEENK